jgi:hypothetical protein
VSRHERLLLKRGLRAARPRGSRAVVTPDSIVRSCVLQVARA